MSVEVEVRLIGILRSISGKSRVSVKLDEPAKVEDVIQRLVELLPKRFKQTLIDPELNDPSPNALVLVNGVEISALDNLETRVKDKDKIVLIPVTHGG